jgi:cytochrome c oxidase subunit 3
MSFLSKITTKPWEHAGEMEALHGALDNGYTANRTGLFLFLAVISSFFLLFIITYYTRSKFPDWEVLTDPRILWVNTAVLVLASVALQIASNAAKQNQTSSMRNALIAGGVLTLAFITGQLIAWDQMVAAGYYARNNPANAFFYLFTGLHALHLLGGMWFLLRLGFRMKQTGKGEKVLQSVTLCATYWHYLLIVWLVLFTLLLRT